MERVQQGGDVSLLDREQRTVAELLQRFRNLINFATARITDKASTGQAAYSSMAMDLETQSFIQAVGDLLSLTRQLRELWIVGPLRMPGEGEKAAEQTTEVEVARVTELLNQIRQQSREALIGQDGVGEYIAGPLPDIPPASSTVEVDSDAVESDD